MLLIYMQALPRAKHFNFYALFSFRIGLYYIDDVYMNEKCQRTKSAVTVPYRCNGAKTENPLLPGVTKLISMLFFWRH